MSQNINNSLLFYNELYNNNNNIVVAIKLPWLKIRINLITKKRILGFDSCQTKLKIA